MRTETLIERTRTAAEADSRWLGSDAHLAVVQEYASARVPRASVVWLKDGRQTYSEGSRIYLGLPEAESPEQMYRLIAASLIHELSHMDYTDASGRSAFDAARKPLAGSKYLWDLSEQLFQWLEDARLQVCEQIEYPEHDELVRENYASATRRLEDSYKASAGDGQLWTTQPQSAIVNRPGLCS